MAAPTCHDISRSRDPILSEAPSETCSIYNFMRLIMGVEANDCLLPKKAPSTSSTHEKHEEPNSTINGYPTRKT